MHSFDDLDDDAWRQTLELNFFSQVRTIRLALEVMRRQGSGVIVNNTSDLARQPEAVPIDYGVSKAAVLSMTKALARSEGPQIRINAVAPGPIWSEFWTKPGGFAETMGKHYNLPPKEAVEHEMQLRQLPMQRLGTAEEVANVVVFLASTSRPSSPAASGRRRGKHPQHHLNAGSSRGSWSPKTARALVCCQPAGSAHRAPATSTCRQAPELPRARQ